MDDSIAFASVCSRCGQQRPQRGYTRTALLNFFNSDYPIEAYCVPCDKFWSISVRERVEVGEAVAVVSKDTPPIIGTGLPETAPGAPQ